DPAVELDLAPDPLAIDGENDVVGLELGTRRRTARRRADHDDLVVDLGRNDPEPWPHRLVDAAELAQIVENWLQEVDRHDHVEVFGATFAQAFDLQRADADQLALGRDQAGATPVRVRWIGEDRLIESILPVTGELLLGGDVAADRAGAAAAPADHDAVADLGCRR